jgi:hypothetical protein
MLLSSIAWRSHGHASVIALSCPAQVADPGTALQRGDKRFEPAPRYPLA